MYCCESISVEYYNLLFCSFSSELIWEDVIHKRRASISEPEVCCVVQSQVHVLQQCIGVASRYLFQNYYCILGGCTSKEDQVVI